MVDVPTWKLRLACSKLLSNGLFLGLRHFHIYLSEQYVEISLRHTQDQILRGDNELRIRLRNLNLGLFVDSEIFLSVNRLGCGNREALGVSIVRLRDAPIVNPSCFGLESINCRRRQRE